MKSNYQTKAILISILIAFNYFSFSINLNPVKNLRVKKIKIGVEQFETITGDIYVPEDYSNASPKLIRLPIFIIKSNSSSPSEPVLFLNGGPGGSNITTTKNTLLLKNHDFVCIGYRGVDGDVVLNSKKLISAARGLNNTLLSDESIRNFKNTISNYLNELKSKGVDINHYTVMDVIDDIDFIRKGLGYEKINLLSISYGTRLALLYDYKFPGNIKRSVMVGVNPPGHFIWWPEKTAEIVNLYDSLYMHQKFRFKGEGSIDMAMKKAFETMPKRWAMIKLDADKIKVGIFAFMFQKDYAVIAFDAIFKAAYRKDYSGLCLIQKMFSYASSKNIWGDAFIKGLPADYDKNIDYVKILRADTSSLGPNTSLFLWGAVPDDFSISIPAYFKTTHESTTETLLISGDLDVSTPADYAKNELLPTLRNGKQIIIKHMSHNDLDVTQLNNYRKTMVDYFDYGNASSSSYQYDEISFKPKKNINRIAKLIYPIILMLK